MIHSLIDTHRMPSAFVEEAIYQYKAIRSFTEQEILQAAKCIWAKRLIKGDLFDSATKMKCFFMTQLAQLEHEVFCVAFLTKENRMIACEEMFRGSIDSSTVYPREVVKRALALNAATVVFAHNHPSGNAIPSENDEALTNSLCQTLSLVGIQVLDHIVVGGDGSTSFAELELL